MSNRYKFVIVIKNIKDPNSVISGGTSNKYKGAYKKIFEILDEDSIFVEAELDDEELKGNDFYLYFNSLPDPDKLQRISKIPNVEVVENVNVFAKGGLIAPNGKPSNLNAKQYELVRTPAFKKWFGDWENDPANASKVVDENGEPLVVYHGTYVENPFYIFDFDKADLGFHFGTYEQAKNRSETKLFFKGRKSIVNSFFLNIKTIFESTDIGEWEYPQRYIDMFVSDGLISESDAKKNGFYRSVQREENKQIREYLLNKYGKFCGFVYNNKYEGKGKSFIVLNPTQIKLADGTNTTFDLANDDIRFEKGGLIAPNGKPSNLNAKQYELVRTPAFKKWFGDWENDPANASKVVDENGEPLVVYHGSYNQINKFSVEVNAHYFTNKKIVSETYGKNVLSCFLSIRTPVIWNANCSQFNDVENYINKLDSALWWAINKNESSSFYGVFVSGNTDGVIVEKIVDTENELSLEDYTKNKNKYCANIYMVSNSNQIKLADGTNTTFDSGNDDIRFAKGGLIAPNGKPSNLNAEQYKLVRTSAFKKWFGDWENDPANASKVIDENGEPEICYHGTFSESINAFDESKIAKNTGNDGHYGYGFYFSYSKIEASTYTYATNPIILECFLNIRNPFLSNNIDHLEKYSKDYGYYEEKKPVAIDSYWLLSELKKRKDQKPYLLYRSILDNGYEKGWSLFLEKNKIDWDAENFDYNRINDWAEYDSTKEEFSKENEFENYNDEIPEHILEDISEQLNIPVSKIKTIKQYTIGNYPRLLYMMDLGNRSRSLTDEIKQDGFDGIIAGSEVVLFKSNQIKLADGTNTTFDSASDDIRFEQGGELDKIEEIKKILYKAFPYLNDLEFIGKGLNGYAFITTIDNDFWVVKYTKSITEFWLTKMAIISNPPNVVEFKDAKELSNNYDYGIIHKWVDRDGVPNKNAWNVAVGIGFEEYKNKLKNLPKKEIDYVGKMAVKLTKEVEDYFGVSIDSNNDNWGYNEKNKLVLFDIDGNINKKKYEDWLKTHSVKNINMSNKLLAPNGKPSNLNATQYKLVRTPAFKKWFGDWENDPANASKVVDENGEPLVVYHGTNSDFWKFDKSKGKGSIKQKSINFSSNKNVSKDYGKRIIQCFLNLKNPFIKNYNGQSYHTISFDARFNNRINDIPDSIVNNAQTEKKYDGVIFLNIKDSKSRYNEFSVPIANNYYAFNNKQIKLADGTNTTFDGKNSDIRFDDGGMIEDLINKGIVELKFYETTPEHAIEYGLISKKPIYLQTIFVSENSRLNGVGKQVLEYLENYAKNNGNDLIFGHINNKAQFTKDDRETFFSDVDMIRHWLHNNGYAINEDNNDFHKLIRPNENIRFAKGGKAKGDCYLVAGQLALEIKNKDIDYKGIPYLVHAEVRHSAIDGLRFGHAFIEDDENVYDFSNNREIVMPKQIYYYFGDINPRDKKKYRKYTFKQAREKMLSTGNYGCWDLEVDYENGGMINEQGFIIEELDNDLKEVYQNRALKNIGGSDFYFSRLNIYPNLNVFTIELPNGNEVGRATLNEKGNYLTNIRLDYDYRRRGLASNLYDYIEYVIGKKLNPSPDKISMEAQKLWLKRNPDIQFKNGGRTIAQTPAPKKDRVYGSDLNKGSSSKDLSSAKLINFDSKTLEAIKNKVKEHNGENPDKKINLASAKAVVRRGMGAYSKSHRPTISGGKPNSRVAWGLARLNAFTFKIVNGKSKSGKYKQDDDLIEELGFKVADYKNGGEMKKDIRCINCGWEWNKKDSELWDMYVCHKCGFDNTTFYNSIPVNNYSRGGKLENKNPDYLKMFLDL